MEEATKKLMAEAPENITERSHDEHPSENLIYYFFLFFIFCVVFYFVYKKQNFLKTKASGIFYENKLPEFSNVAFHKNEIPSRPDENKLPEFSNLAFYKNEIPSRPNGDCIENILTKWRGNNDVLEKHHFYIQWLFPNQMQGINSQAAVLREEEAHIISKSPELRERVKRAFEMMLEFYGMRLTRDNQFELAENAEERLAEMNYWGNHNFLRISRILLALRDLGHQKLMLPWAKFLADLIFKEKLLSCAAENFENYWLQTLDAEDKISLIQYKNNIQSYKEI